MKTLIELFEVGVEKYANNPLMWEKTNGNYQSLSYKQIRDEVYHFGAGLIAIGIEKGDRIGLIAEGRTDWLVAELGMFYAGAVNVPFCPKSIYSVITSDPVSGGVMIFSIAAITCEYMWSSWVQAVRM